MTIEKDPQWLQILSFTDKIFKIPANVTQEIKDKIKIDDRIRKY